jgi:ArsR family transcriptional regulator
MENFADTFKALAERTRLRILNLLLHGEERVCVCEMVDILQLPQYQVSRHLGVLKNAGLVRAHRDGTWAYYELSPKDLGFLRDLFALLKEHLSEECSEDIKALKARLSLRVNGKCVVGFVPEKERSALLEQENEQEATLPGADQRPFRKLVA